MATKKRVQLKLHPDDVVFSKFIKHKGYGIFCLLTWVEVAIYFERYRDTSIIKTIEDNKKRAKDEYIKKKIHLDSPSLIDFWVNTRASERSVAFTTLAEEGKRIMNSNNIQLLTLILARCRTGNDDSILQNVRL